MPGADGFQVAGCAKRLAQPPAIVMMLGASELHSDAPECRRMGIQQYVVKPVSEAELGMALHGALHGFGKELAVVVPIEADAAGPGPLSILLAEDNVVNQKLATRLLEKMGHRVTLAGDGAAAVRAHAAGTFDLILMDVQMPEMNGLEATSHIRAREVRSGERVPIVALTAHAMQGDRDRCLAAGMDDYLSKPLNAAALADKLAEVTRKKQPVTASR
jgi:two-component system sensor histidine kinase/response regulator